MVTDTSYTFVIDTDKYSGNFCREMCAYITGVVGDCGVGQSEQSKFFEEMELSEDDATPFQEVIESKNEAESPYTRDLIGMESDEYGCRRPCKEVSNPSWRDDGHGQHRKLSECDDASEFKHPAFMSVGIIMNHEPKESQVTLMKERAQKYAANNDMLIEGFRLVTVLTIEISKSI